VTALTTARRPRLRELRTDAGWTQQQLADKLAYFAWTRGHQRAGVNSDMVAKWERGTKGISPRYRTLLCQLFGVTPDQLGFAPVPAAEPVSRPVRDPESLVVMLDNAAALLDQLGAAGTALAPQLLSAWKDTATSRRTMLGLLDLAATDPAGHARAATASVAELEQLAERYQALYATADPAALLTPVAAHVQTLTQALRRDQDPAERPRLLRNLAQVATLAGRLAFEDLGDALSGRAYYCQAVDAAREAADDQAAAMALGYTARLAHAEGMTAAALTHLAAATDHAADTPQVAAWLAGIEATVHADRGDHDQATDALRRAEPATVPLSTAMPDSPWRLAAVTGHLHLKAGNHSAARVALSTALAELPTTARRERACLLAELATAELHDGRTIAKACRHATQAADILRHTPHALGATHLRAFRTAAARPVSPKALRALDEHLAHIAA
jgi:transcriptional regulator with XRE-family HTH domain